MIEGGRLLFVKQLRSKQHLKSLVIDPLRLLQWFRGVVTPTNEERFFFTS
jgi:hypothetical protein